MLLLLTLSLLVFGSGVQGKRVKCPPYCKCYRNPSFKSLMTCKSKVPPHTIPRAPSYINIVHLANCNIGYVTEDMARNLSYCNMTSLTLEHTNITGISGKAFRDYEHLGILNWKENVLPVKDFNHLFLNMTSDLRTITLFGKGEDVFDSNMFQRFKSLNKLQLNTIDIKVLNATSLRVNENLDFLDLSDNLIVSMIVDDQIPNLTKLNLEGNNLVEVPPICRPDGSSLVPRLRSLDLGNNAIRSLDVSSLSCLHNLLKLTISQNRIEQLPDNVFANLPRLESLQIAKLWALKEIGDFAFNSSSIVKVAYRENPSLHRNFNPKTLFKYTPKLTTLDLSNTNLQITTDQYRDLLLTLKNIKFLTLASVAMTQLPPGVFSQLNYLTDLDLSSNKLTTWNKTVFENVTNIKSLSLLSNKIKVITEDFFPLEFRLSIKELNLAFNPFTCTCDLLWFKTWMNDVLKNKSITFTLYPYKYTCMAPNVKRLKLKDFNPTAESCSVREIYTVILTMILTLTLVIIVMGLIIYRYRWYLLYWISLFRRRKQRKDVDMDLKYDGFVSYSNPDWDWVSEELVVFLEGEVGLRLCEHSRDFFPGKYIIDNVIEAVDNSRKTILVISNEYMRSAWCQFELKMVLSSYLKNEVDIVVILLEHIKACNVTSSLRALMVSTTYLEWSDDEEAKTLFRERIKYAMT